MNSNKNEKVSQREIKENIIKNNNVIVDMNLKIMKLQQIMSIIFDLNNNQNDNILYFNEEFFKSNSSKLVEIINNFDKVLFEKTKLKENLERVIKNNESKQN